MTERATEDQIRAARPDRSTWLTANAGSGKTRVLTNRVARLLLSGALPESILCLTYTKAAASEMQNRLFETLGAWAMHRDDDLRSELAKLGAATDDLSRARTLFASAIEAPGGLKIQTIHSFCSKILRQFPLEAGVNPQFREMDQPMQRTVLQQVIEELAASNPTVLANARRIFSGENITDLGADVGRNAELFSPRKDNSEVFSAFDVPDGETMEAIVRRSVTSADIEFLKSLVPLLQELGGPKDKSFANALDRIGNEPSVRTLIQLENCLLYKASSEKAFLAKTDIPTGKVKTSHAYAPLAPEFQDIGQRVEVGRRDRIAFELATQTCNLHDFAHEFLPCYESHKSAKGLLDFDDLIRRTKALLTSRSLAWVLYRLDARIDHILVDEAQDTSPQQWDVIEALTGEMVAGESARERTLFVVGDKKQSIYSFQGADAAGFDARGTSFREALKSGSGMQKGELRHSFRSSPAILNCVDAVFGETSGIGEHSGHLAFHHDMPGRVDLWPLVPQPEKDEEIPWFDPQIRTVANAASHQLALKVADEIASLLDSGTIQGKKGKFRRIRPGDFMVLVQRRSTLFDSLISTCKARGLPVAGADRLKIGSELAVRDIIALLSFLALPEDDLSLAAALRSPLLGWSEQDLYDLAARRGSSAYLWQSLRDRRRDFPETYARLVELRKAVDFLRPFELLNEILIKHRGRNNLLSRLGREAEDGIDELLNQALSYESTNVPSLTGFLNAARASEIEVKREAETTGDLIRVMTVHGAKGLESPIVILPDTTFGQPRSNQAIVEGPDGVAALTPSKEKSPPAMLAAREARARSDEEERDRVLYVAMTRAEKWLIVCGVEPAREQKNRLNWHAKIEAGLNRLGPVPLDKQDGTSFLRHETGDWESVLETTEEEAPHDLLSAAVQFEQVPSVSKINPVNPSQLGGEKALPAMVEGDGEGARKGRQLHILLEHLPFAVNAEATAARLLSSSPEMATSSEIRDRIKEAQRVIGQYPEVFAPDTLAEVDVVGTSPTLEARVSGTIDRLLVDDTRVLAVDFKTNAAVPASAAETPEGILRQMGAYLEVLEAIYPDRDVEVAILWTTTGTLMPLGHGIVRAALQRATTS